MKRYFYNLAGNLFFGAAFFIIGFSLVLNGVLPFLWEDMAEDAIHMLTKATIKDP